jgi:hypothetical protein
MTEPEKEEVDYAKLEQGHPAPAPNTKTKCKCCDSRRAVAVLNLGMIICNVFGLIGVLQRGNVSVMSTNNLEGVSTGIVGAVLLVQMIFYGMGVYGALKFNQGFVAAALFAYIVMFLFNAVTLDIGGILVNAFYACPHFFLIKGIRDGTVTKDNYPDEKDSWRASLSNVFC